MCRVRRIVGLSAWAGAILLGLALRASLGEEPGAAVPAVVGQPAAAAKAALESAGLVARFQVGHPAPSAQLEFTAYQVQPAIGTQLARGSTVEVMLYDRAAGTSAPAGAAMPQGTAVPDVVGRSAAEARAAITAAGFNPQFHLGQSPPTQGEALHVYGVEPKPGTTLAAGAEVRLTIYGTEVSSSSPAAATPAATMPAATVPAAGSTTQVATPAPAAPRRSVAAVPTLALAIPSIDPAEHEQKVHPVTGLLSLSIVDLSVPAGSTQLEVERHYRNGRAAAGLLGRSWLLNWEKFLLHDGDDLAVVGPEGVIHLHYNADQGGFRADTGEQLLVSGQKAVFMRTNGDVETYDIGGRLVEVDDGQGNKISLQYGLSGALAHLEGPLGSFLHFTTDEQGRLIQVTASNGASVQYSYGPQAAGPEQPGQVAIRYGYNQAGHLTRIDHPRSGVVELEHDAQARLTRCRWADGSTERYEYDDAQRAVRYTSPAGHVTLMRRSADGREMEVTDPLGRRSRLLGHADARSIELIGPTDARATARYDDAGRLLEVANDTTGTTRWEYEADATLPAARLYPDGQRTEYRFSSGIKLQSVRHGQANQAGAEVVFNEQGLAQAISLGGQLLATLSYNAQGLPESVTDGTGAATSFEYDLTGNLLRETDPSDRKTEYEYDTRRHVVARRDPSGATHRYEYSPAGLLVASIDAAGAKYSYAYDARGRLAAQTDPLQRTTRLQYHTDGQVAAVIDASGHATRLEYDAQGNLVKAVDALGGTTTAQYDALGQVLTETDPAGGVVSYEYTPDGQVTQYTDAAGAVSRWEYDDRGRPIAYINAAEQRTAYEYGPDGFVSKIVPQRGPAITLEHDAQGNLLAAREGERLVARFEYDALGRRTRQVRDTGYELSYRYDAVGNLVAVEDSLSGSQAAEYDAADRPVRVLNAVGAATTYHYDDAGNPVRIVDSLGNAHERQFNLAGELVGVTNAQGDRVAYEYDAVGNIAKAQHPGGGESRYQYDGLGNVVQKVDPSGGTTRHEYDRAGNLIRSTDAKGQTTTYEYDAAGRMTSKQLADRRTVRYTYDVRGNLTSADDGAYPIRWTYDAADNVTQIEYPAIQRKLQYRYDDRDRVVEFIDGEGHSTAYAYDDFGRLASIQPAGEPAIEFSYDAKGRRTAVNYPNGVRGTWQYDALDRTISLTYANKSGETLAGWTYTYDAAGNCTEVANADGRKTSYQFDAAGQLLEEKPSDGEAITYSYAAGGNRSRRTAGEQSTDYRYDQADRLLAAGDETFQYDANGNVIERKNAQGTTRYQWDVENRLIGVTLPGGEEIGYGYAPTGERVWRRDARGMTYYVTDGLHVVAELDALLKPRSSHTYGLGVDNPLMTRQRGEAIYLHEGQVGTVRAVSNSTGALTSLDYDSFGQPAEQQADRVVPMGLSARWYEPQTGLYYFRARWYDPALGRFLSTDPESPELESTLTLNPYQYALNNPTRYVDPMGTVAEQWEGYGAMGTGEGENSPSFMAYQMRNWRGSPNNPDRAAADLQEALDGARHLQQKYPNDPKLARIVQAGEERMAEIKAGGRNAPVVPKPPASVNRPTGPVRAPSVNDTGAIRAPAARDTAAIRVPDRNDTRRVELPDVPPKGRMQRLREGVEKMVDKLPGPVKAAGRGIGRLGKFAMGALGTIFAAKKFLEAEDKNEAAGEILKEKINDTIDNSPPVLLYDGLQYVGEQLAGDKEKDKEGEEDTGEAEEEEKKPETPPQPPPTQTATTTPPPEKPLTPEEEFLRMLAQGGGRKPPTEEQPPPPEVLESKPDEPMEPIHPPVEPPVNPPPADEPPPTEVAENEPTDDGQEPVPDEATDLAVQLIMSLLDTVPSAPTSNLPNRYPADDPPLVLDQPTLDQYRQRAQQLAAEQPYQQLIDNSYRDRANYLEGQLREREIAMERARQEFQRQQEEAERRAAWEDYQRRLAEWQAYQQEVQAWRNYQRATQPTYYYYNHGGGYGGGGGGGHHNGGMIQDW